MFLPRLGTELLMATICWAGLLFSVQPLQAGGQVVAYAGRPFGVGRVTVDTLRGQESLPLSDDRFTLWEANGRVMYPVLRQEPVRRLVRQLLQIKTPRPVTLYFLFSGDTPFDVSVFAPQEQGLRVQPRTDAAGHDRLLEQWWQTLTGRLRSLQKDPVYAPVVENFLVASVGRRLQGNSFSAARGRLPGNKQQNSVLGELFLSEAYQLQVDRDLVLQSIRGAPAAESLPQEIAWAVPESAGAPPEDLEPLAAHVPAECFYVRFGNFSNYFWFRELNQKWQGDLGNMILRRAVERGATARLEQQLSLRESALAKILGPQVIADAALIGLDPYLQQGAAIGILLQAKNNFLLSQDLMRQRRGALQKFSAATESTVQLAGQDVSLVSTPDGRVRSYYAQRKDFHLVTTSASLMERFLLLPVEVSGKIKPDRLSLAQLPSFWRARQKLPVEREDTLFAFVPAEFFQNLCTPEHYTEVRRRLRSCRRPLLQELAQYAAAVERTEDPMLAELLVQGLVSPADGSSLVLEETGWVDSVRGALGYFLPVADVPVSDLSPREVTDYEAFKRRFAAEIGQLPVLAVAAKRQPAAELAGEKLVVDVWALDAQWTKLGKLRDVLGSATTTCLRPIAGDIFAAQAVVDLPDQPLLSHLLARWQQAGALQSQGMSPRGHDGNSEPQHLFGALRDFRSPLVVSQGQLVPGAAPAELVRGYLGAWPRPGILDMFRGSALPAGPQPTLVHEQLWQAQAEEFLLLSFKPDVMAEVMPQLALEQAPHPAQLRVRLADLSGTQMAHNVNALGYQRTRQTSVSASRLMNTLANLLHVPRPQCREVAERLVDGKLHCPLGGEYQLFAPPRSLEIWLSSALPEPNRFMLSEVPAEFELPLLTWFRGLEGELEVSQDYLRAHLEIHMTEAALP